MYMDSAGTQYNIMIIQNKSLKNGKLKGLYDNISLRVFMSHDQQHT